MRLQPIVPDLWSEMIGATDGSGADGHHTIARLSVHRKSYTAIDERVREFLKDGMDASTRMMIPVQHQITFFIPETASTWAQRMEAACEVIEKAFPGDALLTANSQREGQRPTMLASRREFFGKALKTKRRWVSLFNGKHLRGRVDTGLTDEGFITIGGALRGGAPDHYTVHTIHPDSRWDFNEKLLVALGDALQAYTGALSPTETFLKLRVIQFRLGPLADEMAMKTSLPRLRLCSYGGLHASEQPDLLGWLNYWSESTCRYLGFPDQERDRVLLEHSYRSPTGAWLVKLGAEPLDIENPRHLELMEWTYTRFPRLGVRVVSRSE